MDFTICSMGHKIIYIYIYIYNDGDITHGMDTTNQWTITDITTSITKMTIYDHNTSLQADI